MATWLKWMILWFITGSPWLAALIVLVLWWGIDRLTFGLLPDPVRLLRRWRRGARLRRLLEDNPHDRRARVELGELLLERGRARAAVAMLKPAVAAGDDDAHTLYLMGRACFAAGRPQEAEVFLTEAHARDPRLHLGAVDLELGRGRLTAGDARGAREALERFCSGRAATVEGKVLLARALDGLGDADGARAMRQAAWKDYKAIPPFGRRRERWWAWRANPARPLAWLVVAAVLGAGLARWGLPMISEAVRPALEAAEVPADGDDLRE